MQNTTWVGDVATASSVDSFFQAHVTAAVAQVQPNAPEDLVAYLVRLLADFVATPEVPPFDAPLVLVMDWALQGRPHEQPERMRCLGDLALFRCGFFPDQLDRAGVDEHYAAALGGRAYGTVAHRRPVGAEVFAELARRFLDWARVLDEVRERVRDGRRESPLELARLYARYRQSRSPRLARRLARRGFRLSAGEA